MTQQNTQAGTNPPTVAADCSNVIHVAPLMLETFQPTYQFRWVTRTSPNSVQQLDGSWTAFGENRVEVLQQAFVSMTGKVEWKDVPHAGRE